MIGSSFIRIYSLIWLILSPLIPILFLYRVFLKKEDISRFKEKIGSSSTKRPIGKLIWINAVSVGEVRSILPLAEELTINNNSVLITSVTITSANHIKRIISKNKKIIHKFSPLDHPFCINKFLKHWKPNISIFVESEIWPNMILKSYEKKIPLALIQARISKKTFVRWNCIPSLSNHIFNKFSMVITQDQESKNKFLALGATNIINDINLKNLSRAPRASEKDEKDLIDAIHARPVLLFASIHDEIEENASIVSHCEAAKYKKDLLTIIIPRHPQKTSGIISMSKNYNLNYKIRDSKTLPSHNTNIYVANTIGEIGTFFSLSDVCFIGGSLSNKGGHNLIEPALEKCSIIYGPDVTNHQSSSDVLLKANAAIQIDNIEELKKNICDLIANKTRREQLSLAAYNTLQNIPNPTYKILKILNPILKGTKGH